MKNTGWKRFLVFMTIIIMLFNGLGFTGDMFVSAETGDSESSDDEVSDYRSDVVSKDSNLMNMDVGDKTTVKTAILTEALTYDERMQYLVTYAFLADKFGVIEDRSNYNNIYYGGRVSGALDFGLRTDPEEVYQVTADESGDVGETVTGKSSSANEEKDNKKIGDLIKKVETGLGSHLVDTELQMLSPNDVDTYMDASQNPKMYIEGTRSGTLPISPLAVSIESFFDIGKGKNKKGNHIRESSYKSPQMGAGMVYHGNRLEDYKGKIREEAKNTDGVKIKNVGDLLGRLLKDRRYKTMEDDAKRARKASERYKREVSKTFKGSMVPDYVKKGGLLQKNKIKKNLGSKTFIQDIGFMPEILKVYADKHGVSLKVLEQEFLQRTYEDSLKKIKDDKELYKNIEKLIKEVNKEKEVGHEWAGKVEKDSRILGWIPIYPYFNMGELEKSSAFGARFKEEDFNNLLESLDGSTYNSEGYMNTSGGSERQLRRTDLFYSKKATPVLTLNTEESGNNYAKVVVGQGSSNAPSEGTSIGEYAGIASTLPENDIKNYLNNLTQDTIGTAYFKKLNVQSHSPGNGSYNVDMFRNLAAKGANYDIGLDLEKPGTVGVDLYGNIIEADSGTILIPYWQNEIMGTLKTKDYDGTWVSHSAYLADDTASVVKDLINKVESNQVMENKISVEDVMDVFKGTGLKKKDIEDVVLQADSSSMENIFNRDNNKVISALALKIVAGTHKNVKDFHKEALKWGDKSKELFIATGVDLGGGKDAGSEGKYTNDDLRERIMYHLDYGFWDPIKLSLAGLVSDIYSHTVFNSALSSVFYTWKMTDTSTWDDIMRSLGLWLIGLMGVYIVIMSFQVFRRVLTVKDFIKQFVIVSLILLIPTVVYSPLIELLINKPTPMIVGKQMQQMAILDYSQKIKSENEDIDPAYAALFGGNMDLREREHDYIIEFFTTQHKNGYDITDPASVENRSMTDQVRSNTAERTGKWNKKDVVKVDVSMFDLFEWAQQRLDGDEDKSTDLELFEWLQTSEDVLGDYSGIGDYEEYYYDPTIELKKLGILRGKDAEKYDNITASELYLKLYNASYPGSSTAKKITKRLKDLSQIAVVAKENSPTNPVEMEEVEALIRDLSLTREGRETAFGNRGVDDSVIELISTEVPKKGQKRKRVPAISKKSEELWGRVMPGTTLRVPDTDYLGMEDVIDDIHPETGDPREVSNDRHVYNVNEKVLNDYVNIHYIVRESLGNEARGNLEGSEVLMVKLNQFFRTNEELDIPMFPTEILPDTYSLDTYTRMVYVPIAEYKDSEASSLDNVGQYLVLRDNVILLIVFFLPTMAMLILWGLLYLITFGVVMVVLTTISFIWNYVIKRTQGGVENKAWLNAIILIASFAVAKLGLLALWFGMFYVMNELMTLHGGFTYPYMVVHSIIILAYIYVCYKYLFKKVIGNVAKQPLDMGGDALREDLNSTWNPYTKMKKRKADREGRKREKGSQKAIDKQLAKEGKEGKVSTGAIQRGINAAKDKVGSVGSAGRDAVVEGIRNVALGAAGAVKSKFSGVHSGLAKNVSQGLGAGYDGIDAAAGVSGVATSTLDALEQSGNVGQLLTSTAGGEVLSVVGLGDAAEARRLKEHLESQGIESNVNKNGDLLFNSSGLDLEDESVRKNLFGGLVDNLYDEMETMPKAKIVEGDTGKLKYNVGRDGVVTVPVGDDGLSERGLATIINSKEFAESFIVEGTPWVDENGNYQKGSLDIIPRKGVNVHEVLETVFAKDTGHREYLGESTRQKSDLSGELVYEGIEKREDIHDMLETGMYMNEGKVMFSSSNLKHRFAVNNIKKKLEEEYQPLYNDKRQLMTKAMAYTTYGGNSGMDVTSFTTAESEEAANLAGEAGLLKDSVESVVYAGSGSGNVVESVQQLKKIQSLSPELENQYFNDKHELYSQGEGLFIQGKGANRFDKGLNKLATAGREAGGSSKAIDSVMSQYNKLGDDLNSANITSDEYSSKVEGLYNSLQESLQGQGVYTKVLSTEINKQGSESGGAKKALDKYVNTKRKISKEGVDADVIEKMHNSEDYEEVYSMIDGLQSIEDKGDGVVKFTSDRALDEADAARLINKLDMKYKD